MTQEKRVIDYLEKHGSITSLEAINELAVTRISAVIFNLRKDGYNIETEYEKGKNRFGEKTHYGVYTLKNDN